MNRRNFLQSIGLGVAGLYIRFAPQSVKAIPQIGERKIEQRLAMDNGVWEFPVHDRGRRFIGRFDFSNEYPLYTEIEV